MRKINDVLFISILVINIIGLFLILMGKLNCSILKWIIFSACVFVPKVLRKLKISISNTIELLYLILIFLSFILGRMYSLYDKVLWFDTFVHSISGILSFIFGLLTLKYFNKYDDKLKFNILFCLLITLSFGVLWEFIEFEIDWFFNTDMQRVYSTGVMDTMKDISVAAVSSLIISILYIYEVKTKKRILVTPLIDKNF